MQPPPYEAEQAVLAATSELVRRIEIYEADTVTPWANGDNNQRLVDGSVSIDYSNDVRRSVELILDNSDFALEHTPSAFWYDKIIKVFCGVKYVDTTPLVSTLTRKNYARNGSVEVVDISTSWADGFNVNPVVRDTTFVDRTNLIPNPSFETDVLNWTTARGVLTRVSAVTATQGGYIGRFTADGVAGGNHAIVNPRPAVTEGREYTASIDVRFPAISRTVALDIIWFNAASAVISTQAGTPTALTAGTEWTRLSNTKTAPAGAVSAQIRVIAAGTMANGELMEIDGALFEEASEVRSYFDGGTAGTFDFAYAWTGTANGSISTRSFYPISGTGVVKGTASADGMLELLNYNVGMTIGNTYTVSMYARCSKDDILMNVGEYFGTAAATELLGMYWKKIVYTFVHGGGAVGIANESFWGGGKLKTGDSIWIDDLIISDGENQLLSFFDGSTQDFANRVYAWNGTPGLSVSTETTTISTPQAIDTEWEAQVGEFMIDSISEDHFPPVIKVAGRDYTKKPLLAKFRNAVSFAPTESIESVITTMGTNAGLVKFIMPNSGLTLGKTFTFERGMSRWEAMKQIADSNGHDLFFDARGYLVLREMVDPSTTPVAYTLQTGPLVGNMTSYSKTVNDTRIYNKVLVVGESNDSIVIPVSAVAENNLVTSPTNITRLGERLYQYSSPFITTEAQAQDVANKFLKIHALEEFDLTFGAISLFWLEVGEIVEFIDPRPSEGQPTRFLLSQVTLPLGLGPMSGNAKRVSVVG